MPASAGRSPCGSVVMTQRGQGPVTRKRTSSPIAAVWSIQSFSTKPCVSGPVATNDVRPKAANLEAALGIERTQTLDRGGREQMDDGEIEERPRGQFPFGHGVPVVETLHIRPVLLGRRARRLFTLLRLRERDLAAERLGKDPGQISLLARHDRPIGQSQTDGGQLRLPLGRLDIRGAKIEEAAPLARI